MIEVDHVTKRFGNITAVRNVTFHVEKGEILGFLGPNAAGKTTTMRIITAFLPATSGTVRVAGNDVFEKSIAVRERIGYLPENVPLYNHMKVKDYLRFVSRVKGIDDRNRDSRLEHAIELCSIGDVRETIIGKLSKGYKQRVGLAQALIHDPDVLILDEPTNGLDPKQIIEVRELIKNLGGDRTIIVSSHILPEVSMTCGRVVIINEGEVVAEDTPENLTAKLKGSESLFLRIEGSPEGILSTIKAVPGVMSVTTNGEGGYEVDSDVGQDVRRDLAATLVGQGWGLLEMRPIGMSLEEIYLKLTTREESEV
ncbi:MAG: ATP-binding cassette domain-containing protein [Gemmatimonadota bacterium]|nr:MAG: ATP-binding cassette domain-containing protein [Gemmatimonadota bacterium]